MPRNISMDHICKVSYIVDKNNIFYGVVMRESGSFDLYWNMTLVDSCNDPDCNYNENVI
jgi:hypothetical protein